MLATRSIDLRPEDLSGRRWAGYLRESTRGQADHYGPAIQRDEQARYAARYGLLATELDYCDLVSGKDTLRRTDFRRMLADAEAGRFEVLLCYDTSRFARNIADAYRYREQLERLGVVVVFCADGLIAGNTDTYELEGLKTVSDAGYLRRLSRNVGRGYEAKWQRHNDPGGHPPLGFARVGPERLLAPVDGPELETARQLFARYATGVESDDSLAVASGLSEFRVEEILTNPLYAGRAIRHKGQPDEEERPAAFTAPIDPVLFERVQQIRSERRSRHGGGGGFARRPYPLVRLLRCVYCGSPYHGDASNGIRRVRHTNRPRCGRFASHRAELIEGQLAELMDLVQLSDADVAAVLAALQRLRPPEPAAEPGDVIAARRELQRRLELGSVSLQAFTREWRRLDRPAVIPQAHDETQLRRARGYLSEFGRLWRDAKVPDALREEAAREIFERLDVADGRLAAVYPRAEHAWLLGMSATKYGKLELVGARGFEPPTLSSRTIRATWLRHAPTAPPVTDGKGSLPAAQLGVDGGQGELRQPLPLIGL
jgi:site-specific DNA recombinase